MGSNHRNSSSMILPAQARQPEARAEHSGVILVAGEALIDMVPVDCSGTACLRPLPGGSPFNVALALGRLGAPVRFLCPFSTDAFGNVLEATLNRSGVDLAACPRTDALTTIGLVTVEPETGSNRYAFYTQGTAGCALRVEDLPIPLDERIRAVHVGSFALAVEPFGTAIEELVLRHAGDRLVAFDPNVRPFLIADRDAYLRRVHAIAARADLIKLSLEDMEWLHPGKDVLDVAQDYLRGGRTSLVIVTRGDRGAIGFTQLSSVEVSAASEEVADTIGAGDTFQAALIAWLHEQGALTPKSLSRLSARDLDELLTFACGAAAVTCSRPGCDPPWRDQLGRQGLR